MQKSNGALHTYNKCFDLAAMAGCSAAFGDMTDAADYLSQAEAIALTDAEVERCKEIRERIYGVPAEARVSGVLRGGFYKDNRFNYTAHGRHSVDLASVSELRYL